MRMIFVKDVWKEYTGWPLNDMESQYKFMVKHVQLWKVAFHSTSPRWIHCAYLAALAAFYAKELEVRLMEYKRTLSLVFILSCNIFLCGCSSGGAFEETSLCYSHSETLIPATAHETFLSGFNTGVTRCYCPSEEVAKRALLDSLESSQIRDQLRDELEMDPKLPAVLLMGGSEGMGLVKKTAKALGDALFDESMGRPIGQVVVICGRECSTRDDNSCTN
ncbi:hypothetical protein IFM89_028225 [Coptis chinensis]|uniref:Diacylglycerol glucosyltransferase N-terminal domain-containing protein n=1 Tax=Coptis chinensis TaxID=261450 RepID=A0A835M9V7_9MAGN|nr:hypothetical protein IFM89_028225 [Coptis chinensis]